MDTFSTSRRVGGKFSEQRVGKRKAALNFLDFFASFCVKTKRKKILGTDENACKLGGGF